MSATNNDGETPLYIPVTRGNIDMVEFLLKAGADVSAVDNNGFTPLHVAAKYYTTDIITALVDAGSDVHAKNTRGQTPLMVRIQSVAGVHISYILGSIYILTSRGATYDETYDDSLESHAIDSDESEPDEATAAFVLSCVRRWSDEQRRGKSPLTEVPSEIIDRGMTAVKTYLKEVSASTEQELIYRRKMCVVGSSKAGKTSLVKSITSMNATLVDVDDRTIGVDLFRLEFTEEAENSKMHHAITFWDFAGQDEYHVAHSLFFSRRTLYLLCVDAGELSHAVDKTHQARDRGDEDEAEMMVDTFVRERVWRWFRTIFIRQPDAEFVMIATKADMIVLDGESRLRDLESELFHVLSEYKGAFKREMQRDVDALLAECNDGDSAEDGMGRASNERISQLKHLQTQLDQSLPTSWTPVNICDAGSVQHARSLIERVVMNSDRSFLMPTKYSRVLDKITEMRQERPNQLIKDRIRQTFVHLPQLQDELMQTVDGLTQEESETILETLHDLGDVLWYARDGLDVLGDAVILSASMLIDFIRQIVCHDPTKLAGAGSSGFIDNQLVEDMEQGGKIAHELLRSFSLWKRLEYPDQMLHFKQLLQRFRLAFPAGKNEMKADSGLIVPAYWRVRKNQVKLDELEPLVDKLDGYEPEELTHFHWEDDFHHELVETAFEQLAVESYAVFDEREIHGHCIESVENGEFAVRIALGTPGLDSQKRQVILLEVVSIDRELATEYLRLLHEVAGIVLDAYPGLYASCVAVVKRRRRRIDEAIQKMQTATPARRAFLERQYSWLPADVASWYRREKKTKQNSVPLTSPPDLQKITSMYNRQRSMYTKMELMLTKSDDTKETMVNLHAGAGNHRDLPALWMVERVLKPKSKLIVWILSEISGRCFHKPIEFEVSSKFLAAHGDKLTTGLSVFANAIPDEIPVLPMIKDVILGAVSELGTRSQCAARMHSMVDQLDLSTGGVISSNQSRTLPPAESYNLLQKILNEYDENFTTHSISTLTNLECATTKDGKYQWAHREEHSCCQNHLRIEYTNASVASNPLTSPSAASTAWMSMSKSESSNFYMCNFVIDGLAAGKYWRRAYCVWEIREQQGTTVLESGETIQNPHEDPQQQSQWLQSFVLTKMTSAETLSTCELVVTLKRPSRLSLRSDKIIGSGSIKLSDYFAQDAGQKFACDRLVIPLSEQKASIYCHLCAFESQ